MRDAEWKITIDSLASESSYYIRVKQSGLDVIVGGKDYLHGNFIFKTNEILLMKYSSSRQFIKQRNK